MTADGASPPVDEPADGPVVPLTDDLEAAYAAGDPAGGLEPEEVEPPGGVEPPPPESPAADALPALFPRAFALQRAAVALGEAAQPSAPADADGGRPMTVSRHLDELRARLLLCLFAFVPPFVVAIVFYRRLWEWMLWPARRVAETTGKASVEDVINLRPDGFADVFVMIVQLAFWVALIVALPVIVYQIWLFVGPALTATERRRLQVALGAGGGLFVLGAVTGIVWASPLVLAFFLEFNPSMTAVQNLYPMQAYLGLLTSLGLGFGVSFETPLAMWLLARFGLLRTEHLKRWWRHVIVGVFAVAAVATPPEPVSQVLLAGVLLVLLAAGYGLVALAQGRRG